jgi:hypothetical protein
VPCEDGALCALEGIGRGRRELGTEELCGTRLQFDGERLREGDFEAVLGVGGDSAGAFEGWAGCEERLRPGKEIILNTGVC